jgi:hypothetical protein
VNGDAILLPGLCRFHQPDRREKAIRRMVGFEPGQHTSLKRLVALLKKKALFEALCFVFWRLPFGIGLVHADPSHRPARPIERMCSDRPLPGPGQSLFQPRGFNQFSGTPL